jgi:hypothetical protein
MDESFSVVVFHRFLPYFCYAALTRKQYYSAANIQYWMPSQATTFHTSQLSFRAKVQACRNNIHVT